MTSTLEVRKKIAAISAQIKIKCTELVHNKKERFPDHWRIARRTADESYEPDFLQYSPNGVVNKRTEVYSYTGSCVAHSSYGFTGKYSADEVYAILKSTPIGKLSYYVVTYDADSDELTAYKISDSHNGCDRYEKKEEIDINFLLN